APATHRRELLMTLRRALALAIFATAFLLPPLAPRAGASATLRPRLRAPQDAKGATLSEAIQRIQDEGMNRSQVMQTLSYLSDVKAHFDPLGTRRTDADLQRLADAKPGERRGGPGAPGGPGRGRFGGTPEQREQLQLVSRKLQLCQDEGAALVIEPSRRGDGG